MCSVQLSVQTGCKAGKERGSVGNRSRRLSSRKYHCGTFITGMEEYVPYIEIGDYLVIIWLSIAVLVCAFWLLVLFVAVLVKKKKQNKSLREISEKDSKIDSKEFY